MIMKMALCLVPLIFLSMSANADQTLSQWQFVKGSDSEDFQILCLNDQKQTLYIGKNNQNNEYRVARNIFFQTQANNTTILSFKRGFVSADKDMTYIPSANERCEITEQ
ncbi:MULTISPECIES: hypothetical protein [Rahnella]|uniref:Uncharacterized protein n=1 Tax=Rahnella laticis TaxID=2787622 RepID=A0ABS0ED98_9GAMM|nr:MULTISPECIES: hypothetical protein [Rahnella]MBF7982125.1 hypothetical protein [Rahnella laticis]MBF8002215.1 hypothetical protein [Rahnella sp. LAC-M12]